MVVKRDIDAIIDAYIHQNLVIPWLVLLGAKNWPRCDFENGNFEVPCYHI